ASAEPRPQGGAARHVGDDDPQVQRIHRVPSPLARRSPRHTLVEKRVIAYAPDLLAIQTEIKLAYPPGGRYSRGASGTRFGTGLALPRGSLGTASRLVGEADWYAGLPHYTSRDRLQYAKQVVVISAGLEAPRDRDAEDRNQTQKRFDHRGDATYP